MIWLPTYQNAIVGFDWIRFPDRQDACPTADETALCQIPKTIQFRTEYEGR